MKEFTKETTQIILDEVEEALSKIAEKHELRRLSVTNASHNPFKISFKLAGFTALEYDKELLLKTALGLGLTPVALRSYFIISDRYYRIIDFDLSVKPVILEDIQTLDRYCVSAKQLLKAKSVPIDAVDVEDDEKE